MKISRVRSFLLVGALGVVSMGCQARGPAAAEVQLDGLRPHYLEIVTPEVDATCSSLEETHGLTFGPAQADLGGGRTAPLIGGGLVGVRAPLHAAEKSVVRPYLLVDDIEVALENATNAGAQIAMGATEIPGRGTFAIYFLGGIEHGLWQL